MIRLTLLAEDAVEKPSTDNTKNVELVDTPELKPEDTMDGVAKSEEEREREPEE